MAFKTFTPGVLTASDVNTYLMQQAVITCTSSTRPSSPVEGMTIYESDTDVTRQYSGSAWEIITKIGAWQSWTPTLSSFGAGTDWAIGNGTAVGTYQRVGRLIAAQFLITFGSTTTFGTKFLLLSLPVTARSYSGNNPQLGTARIFDASVGNSYIAELAYYGTTTMLVAVLATSSTYATSDAVTSTVPITWATGDSIAGTIVFEAAA